MYRIGVVARLAQVSIRTLRHYDELGLLPPARVDDTGYRWYGPSEIARLHRILVMRDLGLSLTEISEMLDAEVTEEQLRGILLLRRAEGHERIASERTRLARVEARIALLEGDAVTDHDVTMKELDPIPVVAVTETHDEAHDNADVLGRLYPRLHRALAAHEVEAGPFAFALYDDLDHNWQEQRVTAAFSVRPDVDIDADGVQTKVLPAVRAAATVVHGAPDVVYAPAFQALHDWLEAMGALQVTQLREVYVDCDGPRDTWVTELQAVLADGS